MKEHQRERKGRLPTLYTITKGYSIQPTKDGRMHPPSPLCYSYSCAIQSMLSGSQASELLASAIPFSPEPKEAQGGEGLVGQGSTLYPMGRYRQYQDLAYSPSKVGALNSLEYPILGCFRSAIKKISIIILASSKPIEKKRAGEATTDRLFRLRLVLEQELHSPSYRLDRYNEFYLILACSNPYRSHIQLYESNSSLDHQKRNYPFDQLPVWSNSKI